MFFIEKSDGRSYFVVNTTEVADTAIEIFNGMVDALTPKESLRITQDDKTMARKTPKGTFIAKEWQV